MQIRRALLNSSTNMSKWPVDPVERSVVFSNLRAIIDKLSCCSLRGHYMHTQYSTIFNNVGIASSFVIDNWIFNPGPSPALVTCVSNNSCFTEQFSYFSLFLIATKNRLFESELQHRVGHFIFFLRWESRLLRDRLNIGIYRRMLILQLLNYSPS